MKAELGFTPIMPEPGMLDSLPDACSYDDDADTLYVYFLGKARSGVSVAVNEYLYWRVDRETKEVVGFQLDGFLSYVVREYPEWLPLAEELARLRVMSDEAIQTVRAKINPEKRRQAAVRPIRDRLSLAPV